MSLGLEQAGFFPLYVNELNKDALESYLINRESEYPHLRDPKFHSQDIKDCINSRFFKDLKNNLAKQFGSCSVDLICGGPPCQGFSGIGLRRSYSVEKRQLPSNHLYQLRFRPLTGHSMEDTGALAGKCLRHERLCPAHQRLPPERVQTRTVPNASRPSDPRARAALLFLRISLIKGGPRSFSCDLNSLALG